jgi:hypothetical protein
MNPFAIAVFAALSLAPAAEAQNNAVLNSIEVRQLTSRSNPADHQRLAAHFNALADQYASESQRHASMIHSDGNPSRNPAMGNSPHCHHLAEVNRESAAAARELGAHHLNLARGSRSTFATALVMICRPAQQWPLAQRSGSLAAPNFFTCASK